MILALVLTSMIATSWLVYTKNISPVRASSLVTMFIVLIITFFLKNKSSVDLNGAVLGGSFVGMTDPKRLNGKYLYIAGLLYCLGFYYLIPYNMGFGGILGLFAFSSCTVIYILKNKLVK